MKLQHYIAWIVRLLFATVTLCLLGCAHHEMAPADIGSDSLAAAVLGRDYEKVTKLLEQGYPVAGKSVQPNEPAFWAITENDAKALKLLIRYGLNVDYDWGYAGGNLLTNAVQWGHIEIVKLLCDAGASTRREPKMGRTPLYAAIIYDKKDIERYLRERGARLNEWDLDALRVLGLQAN